ncbi:MAG: GIY-YIG nuclease family protein [Sphingobacteriaceae bacterium]|nr:GIY-YIG nuclease family protein [Sphingobacteriaceae bacterium]
MFYTYILYSVIHNRFYIGQSRDIDQRINFHNKGNVRSTKPFIPWEIVGYIEKPTRSEAVVLERKLKNLNSEDLKKFILKYFEKSFQ